MKISDGWNYTAIKLNKNLVESLLRCCGVGYSSKKGLSTGAYTMQNIRYIKRK